MNTLSNENGFATYVLRDALAETRVVPALGGKITSLRDLRTGREWLWAAPDGRGLYANRPGDAFERGPMAGIDDCLPTVAPASFGDLTLPDHGEIWTSAFQPDPAAWERGEIKTTHTLATVPLRMERTLRLHEGRLSLDYSLENLSERPLPWLWALHPLFARREGDRVELPAEVGWLRVGAKLGLALDAECAWPVTADGADLAGLGASVAGPWYAKFFTPALREGWAALVNDRRGEKLKITFNTTENPFLGLWITRGGWNGFDHFALEPTNHADDAPSSAPGAALPPGVMRRWSVGLALGA